MNEIKTEEWEAICNRCGQCCFEKWVDEDGSIRHTLIPCRFLDIVSRQCKVYHKRLDVDEGCVKLTPELVRTVRWLPQECAYTRLIAEKKKKRRPRGRSHPQPSA